MNKTPLKSILALGILVGVLSNVEVRISEAVVQTPVKAVEIKEKKVDESWYIKDIPFSKKEQEYVVKKCEEYGVDVDLLYSLIMVESQFNGDEISPTKDYGFCQVNIGNKKYLEERLGRDIDLLDFKDNIESGCIMLSDSFKAWKPKYEDDEKKWILYAVNSYNMGVGGFKKYVSRGGSYTRRSYGAMVFETYNEYLKGNYKFNPYLD